MSDPNTFELDDHLRKHDGLQRMVFEMDRQCSDALHTLSEMKPTASRIAKRIRDAGAVTIYGMGGSHHVNRIAERLYLDAGISCRSINASDALMERPVRADGVSLFTSQSGESGEIVELLSIVAPGNYTAGLTLDDKSTLTKTVNDVMVGHGGPETAFAATRSITLTLAMHAAILQELGLDQSEFVSVMGEGSPSALGDAADGLSTVSAVVISGRHVLAGVAGSASLSLMELARVPTIGFETGQFRHGPFEMLGGNIGVILLRSAGRDIDSIPQLVRASEDAGCPTLLLDTSGKSCAAANRIEMRTLADLGAAAQILLTLQHLNIQIAVARIADGVGTPLRTSKVTI